MPGTIRGVLQRTGAICACQKSGPHQGREEEQEKLQLHANGAVRANANRAVTESVQGRGDLETKPWAEVLREETSICFTNNGYLYMFFWSISNNAFKV